MATKKKMLQAAAGNAGGGAALNVEDVFSTYLYEADGTSSQTITNNIDLSTEGGLVLLKSRAATSGTWWYDTERGVTKELRSDSTGAESTESVGLTAFNTDGFTFGFRQNQSAYTDSVSWSFRKAPKFFTCVTWTGDGVNGRYIDHNLGVAPGFVVVKRTDSSSYWAATHKDAAPLSLNTNLADNNIASLQNGYVPSGGGGLFATNFRLFAYNGNMDAVNASGGTYVAYLFAHNDGDGEFGGEADADIIKCGSYTGNDASQEIDIGFEPQWLMVKRTSDAGDWNIYDSMRNWITSKGGSGDSSSLKPNDAGAESAYTRIHPSANGFGFDSEAGGWANQSGHTYIYMAIRRGTKVPESGTEVFDTVTGSGVQSTGFPVDFLIGLNNRTNTESYDPFVKTRLLGGASYLTTSSTAAEASGSDVGFDTMDGLTYSWPNSNAVAWYWKRAPGFFDAVAFSGTGVAGRTVSHNLGVAPEMIWVKARSAGDNWYVYHKDLTSAAYALILNSTTAQLNAPTLWNSTTPTDSVFTVGSDGGINGSTKPFITYLFSSLDGISKVGSYTGDGTTGQTIDCGFASGARFILIKRTDTSSNWFVWDTERGIVSGNDPYLRLNRDLAEETTQDDVDPQSSGFIVNQGENNLNQSGGSYIFYAIA